LCVTQQDELMDDLVLFLKIIPVVVIAVCQVETNVLKEDATKHWWRLQALTDKHMNTCTCSTKNGEISCEKDIN